MTITILQSTIPWQICRVAQHDRGRTSILKTIIMAHHFGGATISNVRYGHKYICMFGMHSVFYFFPFGALVIIRILIMNKDTERSLNARIFLLVSFRKTRRSKE